MGSERRGKVGLTHWPCDVDLWEDIKIRKLIKNQGGKAPQVYINLLGRIYKVRGYYLEWDKELPFIVSDNLGSGYDEGYVFEVIKACISIGLFSEEMFEKGVLTSLAIQERYADICSSLRRKCTIDKFSLFAPELPLNDAINEQNVAIKGVTAEDKHTIEKNRIEVNTPHTSNDVCPPLGIPEDFVRLYEAFRGKKKGIQEEYDEFLQKYNQQDINFPLLTEYAATENVDVYLQTWLGHHLGIEVRQKAFYDTLIPFLETYPKEMLRDFYDYWSEPDRGAVPKMRCEKEKTWSLAGRLRTWAKNETKFGSRSRTKKGSTISEVVQATAIPDGGLGGQLDITKLLGQ